MAFSIIGTELVQTASPAYATDLVGIAGVIVVGDDNFVIDTSAFTAVKLNGDFIVNRNLIITTLKVTSAANKIYMGVDHLGSASRPVNLTVLSNSSEAFQRTAFGVVAKNSSITTRGALGYFNSGPVWDISGCVFSGTGVQSIGASAGSVLDNSSIIDFAYIVFFGSPASTDGFRVVTGITPTFAFIDSFTGVVALSKFDSPAYNTQRRGAFDLTDCRVGVYVQGRGVYSTDTAYYAFKRTLRTEASGANANASTTRYVYASDGSPLVSSALASNGVSSAVVQWGKIYTLDMPLNTQVPASEINTNASGYHRAGEYKLPLKVAHVSYLGALDITSGITFDVTAAEYLEPYSIKPNLVNDSSITETVKATVDSYTTIETSAKLYDRAKSWLVDNYTGQSATLVSRSGSLIDAGSYNVTIDATAASAFAFDGTTITIKASTYTGDMTTTGVITLANGATFIGTRTDANGTVAPPKVVSITGIVAGSRLQIYNVTTATETFNGIVAGTSYSATYSEGTGYSEGDTVRVRLAYSSGVTAKLPFTAQAIVGASGWSVLAAQQDDDIYIANGVDGSAVTKFTADYNNNEIDVAVTSNFTAKEAYAFYVETLLYERGIREWFGAITAEDVGNYRVNASIVSMLFDNTTASTVWQTDNARIYRSDEARPVRYPTTGGGDVDVQWRKEVYTSVVSTASPVITGDIADVPTAIENAAAVLAAAQSAPIYSEIRRVNGVAVDGTGTDLDPWGPVG